MSSQKPAYVRGTQAAQALRHREQLGFEPVDIWQVLERLEIPVAIRDFGDEAGDGLYLWEQGEPFIVINKRNRPSRQRFTAAHELGHHEMHRFDTDRLVLADQDIYGSQDDWEIEANAFAADFLAPGEGIRQRIGDRAGEEITQDMVVELIGTFGLSYDAMTYRLLNAQLINRAQRDALADNPMVETRMRRAGIDDNANSKPPAHLPRSHISASLRLYEDHVVTSDRLGELLDMTGPEAIVFAQSRGVSPVDELPVDDAAVDALLLDT
jgi:Zn-dependent peptidase ImmA (M78 family)